MSTAVTQSRVVRNDSRELVYRWADEAVKSGGVASVVDSWEGAQWVSTVTITWPEKKEPKQ